MGATKLLQVKTKCNEKDESVGDEPVSPTGQFLNSKTLSVSILVVLESEVPIADSIPIKDLFRDILLPVHPRFSSIMVHDKNGVQYWKRVEIDLDKHINIPTFPTGLSLQQYDIHFSEYLTEVTMKELPQDRPLWEVHITKYPTTKAAGHCIFKFHHAIGDGYSLMSVLLSCLRRADNPSVPFTFPSLQRSSGDNNGTKTSVLSTLYNTVCDYGWSVFKTFVADDKTPIRSGTGCVHGVEISTTAFLMDDIKIIKNNLGLTVNDVITGIVFLGIRLYMQQTSPTFRNSKTTALVLLNTRIISGYMSQDEINKTKDKTKWGNQFAFIHLPVPILTNEKLVNPLDFLTDIHKMTTKKKNSLAVYLIGVTLEMLRKFRGPEAGAKYMHSTLNKATMEVTNMIGPLQKVSLADHPCKGLYFTVIGAPKSLSVSIMSYMDTLRIAVGVQKDFIDSKKLISCIDNAFELIYKATLENASIVQV